MCGIQFNIQVSNSQSPEAETLRGGILEVCRCIIEFDFSQNKDKEKNNGGSVCSKIVCSEKLEGKAHCSIFSELHVLNLL